jgi:iron transport multicopper oxidase
MRRDTLVVWPLSNFVIRFRADNPGIWLFHCHIEWHTAVGLIATLIEAPLDLQSALTVPEDHFQACKAQGIPTAGNAAGNTANLLDLSGENKAPKPLPSGFEARGIVALVFSCLSAFLGLVVIAWYGMLPITNPKMRGIVERIGDVRTSGSTESGHGVVQQIVEMPKTG